MDVDFFDPNKNPNVPLIILTTRLSWGFEGPTGNDFGMTGGGGVNFFGSEEGVFGAGALAGSAGN